MGSYFYTVGTVDPTGSLHRHSPHQSLAQPAIVVPVATTGKNDELPSLARMKFIRLGISNR